MLTSVLSVQLKFENYLDGTWNYLAEFQKWNNILFHGSYQGGWSDVETIFLTGENCRRGRSSTVLHFGEERRFLKKIVAWYLSCNIKKYTPPPSGRGDNNQKTNTKHILSFILRTPKNARNIHFYLSLVDTRTHTCKFCCQTEGDQSCIRTDLF